MSDPDQLMCIYNGHVANQGIGGGYECLAGGALMEQGTWQDGARGVRPPSGKRLSRRLRPTHSSSSSTTVFAIDAAPRFNRANLGELANIWSWIGATFDDHSQDSAIAHYAVEISEDRRRP